MYIILSEFNMAARNFMTNRCIHTLQTFEYFSLEPKMYHKSLNTWKLYASEIIYGRKYFIIYSLMS